MQDGIPESDRALQKELRITENDVDFHETIQSVRKAQMYVCLAHDWFQMDIEEEGDRLLQKAEFIHPGYFKGPIADHIEEDKDFKLLVRNITVQLSYLMITRLGDKLQ